MITYEKPHLLYHEQIQLLKNRNLIINDEDYALQKLKHISYYRLSAYFIPFYSQKDIFTKGTIMTTETCEETGDESNYQKDLKQDLKITNITALHNDNIWF